MAEGINLKVTKKDLEIQFKAIDAGHNGKLSFLELLSWYREGKHTTFSKALIYQLNLIKAGTLFEKSVGTPDGKSNTTYPIIQVEMEDGKAQKSHL